MGSSTSRRVASPVLVENKNDADKEARRGSKTAAATRTEVIRGERLIIEPDITPMNLASSSPHAKAKGVYQVPKSDILEERAKKLGTRFGLEIQPWEWLIVSSDEMVLRTDKSIRMRIRWECHCCNLPFAASTKCSGCHHQRCTSCLRFPAARSKADVTASRDRRAQSAETRQVAAPTITDYRWNDSGFLLTRPSKTGGMDLIHRAPRQRIRRTCHECQSAFDLASKICEACGHIRCTDCPREPAKKEKYPLGYPGDEFGPSSTPYYECIQCRSLYDADAKHGTPCYKCGCEMSSTSPRAKPQAVELRPDPAVLKLIQSKLDTLDV